MAHTIGYCQGLGCDGEGQSCSQYGCGYGHVRDRTTRRNIWIMRDKCVEKSWSEVSVLDAADVIDDLSPLTPPMKVFVLVCRHEQT